MCVFMVRSRVKTEGGSEVEAAIEKAFPAIAEAQPLEKEGRAHRGSRRFHDAANPGDGFDHRHGERHLRHSHPADAAVLAGLAQRWPDGPDALLEAD
jgi:hypothetical protein